MFIINLVNFAVFICLFIYLLVMQLLHITIVAVKNARLHDRVFIFIDNAHV